MRCRIIWTIGVITSAWKELNFLTHLRPYTYKFSKLISIHFLKGITVFIRISAHPKGRKRLISAHPHLAPLPPPKKKLNKY